MHKISQSEQQIIDKFWEFFPPVWHSVKAHIRHDATEKFDITVGQFHILRRIRQGADSVSKLFEQDRTRFISCVKRKLPFFIPKALDRDDDRFLQ